MSVVTGRKNRKPSIISTQLLAVTLAFSLASCRKQGAEVSASDVAQKTFASSAEAGLALFEAAKSDDQNALMAIFGPEGEDILFSGDAVKDKNARQRFIDAYSQMNRWSSRKSGDQILYIGADNFPFPIPLSRNASGQWAFNTTAGRDEILARRIGDGELTAIGILTEIANAQQEYFSQTHQFAQKFSSDDNEHNGLYWAVKQGQRPSPLAHLAEEAKALGYSQSDKPQPFNGYHYKILTQQGDAANGGAKDYIKDGKLVAGFAVLAWPAKYRDSGIMTFMVGKDGRIYQRDLGQNTSDAATAMTAYNPGSDWTIVLSPESTTTTVGLRASKP